MYDVRPLTFIYLDLAALIQPCQYQDIGQFRIKVKNLKIFLFEDELLTTTATTRVEQLKVN